MTGQSGRDHLQDEFIRRGLRLAHLRLLVALQETGQMSGAAAKLNMTQPAASRLMAEIEQITGTTLYARHARGVTLSDAGKYLAETAHIVLRKLDEAHAITSDLARGRRGLVRIGSVTAPALDLLLPVTRELRETDPEIEISITVETSDRLIEGLLSRDLDFYIGRLPDDIDPRAVRMRRIGPEPIALIARAEHPLAQQERISIAEALPFDWVQQPKGSLMRRTVETWFLEAGLDLPARVISTSSLMLTLALISDSNAVAPVSHAVGSFYARRSALGGDIQILPLREEIAVSPFSIVSLAGVDPSAATRRVLTALEKHLPSQNPLD